jgi:hypothetical protein
MIKIYVEGLAAQKCSPEGSIDQVADSHHFAEEQDPEREKLDPDPHYRDADPQPCRGLPSIESRPRCALANEVLPDEVK